MGWTGTEPSKWADVANKRQVALLRNSVQALAVEASRTVNEGGRVPVKTSNLSRSVVIDDKPPQMDAEGVVHTMGQDFSLGVADIVPGEPIYIGWTARYARRQNYGFVGTDSLGRTYNQAGFGFAEATAAKWPAIVQAEARKIGGR